MSATRHFRQFAPNSALLRSRSPRLGQCLALALLLHLWLVLLVGNTPGGSARPGDGVWGRLNVSLLGPANGRPEGERDAQPAHQGPAGQAPQQRFGGTVRSPARTEAAPPTPGAAQLGTWAPQPSPAEPEPTLRMAVPANSVTPLSATALTPPAAMPALAPADMTAPSLPALISAPSTPLLRQLAPAPGAAVERLRPAPLSLNKAAAALAPADLAAPSLPALAPAPLLRRMEPAPSAAVERLRPAPLALKQAAPAAVPQLPDASVPPLPSLQALAPAPEALPAAAAALPGASPAPSGAANPTPPGQAGQPDAGHQLGRDVATPPSASSTPPQAPAPLNLSLPTRPRGGQLPGAGSRGVLELLPLPPERKSKLAEEMEKAGRPDCRQAYADGPVGGLLAVVPLALDAVRDKGCRW